MRLLGLDPGLRVTGWGVIEASDNRLRHVADGVVRSRGNRPLAERLVELHEGLAKIIAVHRPDAAAVEETFVAANARSALQLGHARGIALLAAAGAGLPVREYAANVVKRCVVGYGHAAKPQVALMVGRLLPGAVAQADAADALAVAICDAHHEATQARWMAAS